MQIKKNLIRIYVLMVTILLLIPSASASRQPHDSDEQKNHPVKFTKYEIRNIAFKSQDIPSKIKQLATYAVTYKASHTTLTTKKKHHATRTRKSHKSTSAKKSTKLPNLYKIRVQKAQKIALNKLMGQIGKPYRWGGSSPRTGFDCSGLVYYVYKDLVKFRIPRTANEMYHLRVASPVNRSKLESGDLVFFRTQGRGAADHVGVYLGNGKFIQSPRSGQDIQITSLNGDYWVRHYVGARRVMTPKTIR